MTTAAGRRAAPHGPPVGAVHLTGVALLESIVSATHEVLDELCQETDNRVFIPLFVLTPSQKEVFQTVF